MFRCHRLPSPAYVHWKSIRPALPHHSPFRKNKKASRNLLRWSGFKGRRCPKSKCRGNTGAARNGGSSWIRPPVKCNCRAKFPSSPCVGVSTNEPACGRVFHEIVGRHLDAARHARGAAQHRPRAETDGNSTRQRCHRHGQVRGRPLKNTGRPRVLSYIPPNFSCSSLVRYPRWVLPTPPTPSTETWLRGL